MTRNRLYFLAPLGLLLAGCTNLGSPMAVGDGSFAETNFAAQVVDPTPADGAPAMDAAMSDAAIARYRAGEVKSGEDEEPAVLSLNLSPAT